MKWLIKFTAHRVFLLIFSNKDLVIINYFEVIHDESVIIQTKKLYILISLEKIIQYLS